MSRSFPWREGTAVFPSSLRDCLGPGPEAGVEVLLFKLLAVEDPCVLFLFLFPIICELIFLVKYNKHYKNEGKNAGLSNISSDFTIRFDRY